MKGRSAPSADLQARQGQKAQGPEPAPGPFPPAGSVGRGPPTRTPGRPAPARAGPARWAARGEPGQAPGAELTEARPHQDATEAAKPLNVSGQSNGGSDRNRGLLPLLVYVTHRRDRTPLNRLTTAAGHGRDLIDGGADRVTVVTALVLGAEAVGAPRDRAEAVVCSALRGAA